MPEQFGTGSMLARRNFLRAIGFMAASQALRPGFLSAAEDAMVNMPFPNGQRRLVSFPQKRPLILLTSRPPQLETPFAIFNEGLLTPNDAFFVRYHLSQIPVSIDEDKFRLEVKGKVNSPLNLSMADLRNHFESAEIVAVNQCSGNGRGFFEPRVAGGQLGNGAMGNARWKGVRLKDVLNKAGVAQGSRQVSFNGMDNPVSDKTPDFVKAIEIDHALDEDVMLAYEMNGQSLPMLNGFPLRLVLPGHYGTYWVKHLNEITVLAEPFSGFWMDTAYRIPDNTCACVEKGTAARKTIPIQRYNPRSFITSLADNSRLAAGTETTIRGIAFDGGYGITEVLFSGDGGRTWRKATLGQDLGKYSFREWTAPFKPDRNGEYELMVRATNRIGQSQPDEPLWNPAGYMRNVVEKIRVKIG